MIVLRLSSSILLKADEVLGKWTYTHPKWINLNVHVII